MALLGIDKRLVNAKIDFLISASKFKIFYNIVLAPYVLQIPRRRRGYDEQYSSRKSQVCSDSMPLFTSDMTQLPVVPNPVICAGPICGVFIMFMAV